jgi:putative flippase GtrA
MKIADIIIATASGVAVAWVAVDIFGEFTAGYWWLFFIVLPLLAVFGLWLAFLISKKIFFVKQAAKFSLAGAFTTVVDIKIFQLLYWFAPFPLIIKAISFLTGTFVKYWFDKYWSFSATGGPASGGQKFYLAKEMVKFFTVAILGSAINVASFYFFSKIETGLDADLWREICIILAIITTATWNFLGYKYVVFKK